MLAGVLIIALVMIGILIFLRRRSRRFTLSIGDYNPLMEESKIELEDSAAEMDEYADKDATAKSAPPKLPDDREVVVLGDDEGAVARVEV